MKSQKRELCSLTGVPEIPLAILILTSMLPTATAGGRSVRRDRGSAAFFNSDGLYSHATWRLQQNQRIHMQCIVCIINKYTTQKGRKINLNEDSLPLSP